MAQANSDSTMVIADLDHSDDDEDLQRAIALSLPGCSLQSVTDPALDQEYSPPACYFWLANGDFVWAQTDAGLRFARLLRRLVSALAKLFSSKDAVWHTCARSSLHVYVRHACSFITNCDHCMQLDRADHLHDPPECC